MKKLFGRNVESVSTGRAESSNIYEEILKSVHRGENIVAFIAIRDRYVYAIVDPRVPDGEGVAHRVLNAMFNSVQEVETKTDEETVH